MPTSLSSADVKKFYDKFGSKQDWQSFYENAAIDELIDYSDFTHAKSVFEFGCGTGAFAEDLLNNRLSDECRYIGIDLSDTMVDLTEKRIRKFGGRAQVKLTDGTPELGFPEKSFDRFVSNYVLEILSDEDINGLLVEANRILDNDGLLCVVNLSCGDGLVSRTFSNMWGKIHRIRPMLVGGCRPLEMAQFATDEKWRILKHSKTTSFGIASEILIAKKITGKNEIPVSS